MKIAELVATFPPHHGGMGYVCYYNALELVQRGHDVTVLTLDHGRSDYEEDHFPFKIVRLKTPLRFGDAGIVPQLFFHLRDYDIIHLHYPFFGGAEYVWLAALLFNKKYFLTYHMDVEGGSFLRSALLKTYEATFTRLIMGKASGIGALSMEHLASTKIGSLVNWSRVLEMPNGVDSDLYCPREKNQGLLEQLGLKDKTVVLFVGNLQPFKALHLLIDAIADINDKNLVLLVVGGSYDIEKYQAQVSAKKMADRVLFVGPQSPQGALPEYFNLGDMLVLPSTHSEAFPLVVLEAMASGLPVIVSSLPGPSSMVDKEKDGLVVPIGDRQALSEKIVTLAKNISLREKMGSAGREKIMQKYRWARIGDKLETVLQEIFKSK